jgi:antitoxin (DNA-binding transcriptional repressor) of toxin-antitoxin stability system
VAVPTYTVHTAKTQLSRLIAHALAGENVIIARDAEPVVRLVPVNRPEPRRLPGTWRGRLHVGDAFFEPLTPEELSLYEGGGGDAPAP